MNAPAQQQDLVGVAPPRFEADLDADVHKPWPIPIGEAREWPHHAPCSCGLRVPANVCDQGRGCPLREDEPAGPLRRPPDVLPLGVLMLAGAFVLGFIAGAAGALWWVAR